VLCVLPRDCCLGAVVPVDVGLRRILIIGAMYPVADGIWLKPCCMMCRLLWLLFLDFIVGGWITVS